MTISPPVSGLLARRDPRCKLAGFLFLALALAGINDLRLLPPALTLALLLLLFSGLPAGLIIHRLRYPSLLLLALLILLPLVSGRQPLFSAGPLTVYREGLEAALLLGGRFLAIVLSALALVASSSLPTNIKALRALGLPWIMADLAMLMFRYLQVLSADLARMRAAMQCRGFKERKLSPANLRKTAWLTGSLLLRGSERADLVYQAMRLRGYGNPAASGWAKGNFRAGGPDYLLLALLLLPAILITIINLRLS